VIELLKNHDPDVVLSVHPLLNHISHQAIRKSDRPRALMTVITDLGRLSPRLDLQPSRPRDRFPPSWRARWRSAEGCRPTASSCSAPGRPSFPAAGAGREAARSAAGLDSTMKRFTVLVMGGGAGVGHLKAGACLATDDFQWQVVVVCGRNEKLRRRLAELPLRDPTLVWVSSITCPSSCAPATCGDESRAGRHCGGARHQPALIITGFLPGQESPNVDFVVDSGFGQFAPKDADLLDEVRVLAEGGPTGVRCPARPRSWRIPTPLRHRSRGSAPRGALQGFGADEPVRAQPAAPPLGPRLESPGLNSLRDLRALAARVGDQLGKLLDPDALAAGQIDDLQFQRIQVERGAGAQRVERDLQIAAPAIRGRPLL